MKKVLFITNNLNQWGQKYIAKSLTANFDTFILTLDDGKVLNRFRKIPDYNEKNAISRFVTLLRLFIIPPKTSNYKYGKKRNYLARRTKLKMKLFYFIEFFFPKLINEHTAAKLAGYFAGNIDLLLEEIKPEIIVNLAFFTNQYPAARSTKLGYKVFNIVYSWDNPFKDSFLPNIYNKYLVWNKELIEDLSRLHSIPVEKQIIINPIQFDYLKNDNILSQNVLFNSDFYKKNKQEYYLFLFSCGYRAASQEVQFFKYLIQLVHNLKPRRKIVLRPYPNVSTDDVYDVFNKLDNCYLQNNTTKGIIQKDNDVYEKSYILRNAMAIINLGTTMALEASFFEVPIIQLAYLPPFIKFPHKDRYRVLDIDYILKNDHLHKYLIKHEYPNVVFNDEQFMNVIEDIENNNLEPYKNYTKYLNGLANPNPEKLASELLIEALINK